MAHAACSQVIGDAKYIQLPDCIQCDASLFCQVIHLISVYVCYIPILCHGPAKESITGLGEAYHIRHKS